MKSFNVEKNKLALFTNNKEIYLFNMANKMVFEDKR